MSTGSAGERLCQKGKSIWSLPGVTVAFGALNALFWVYAMYKALQVRAYTFLSQLSCFSYIMISRTPPATAARPPLGL